MSNINSNQVSALLTVKAELLAKSVRSTPEEKKVIESVMAEMDCEISKLRSITSKRVPVLRIVRVA